MDKHQVGCRDLYTKFRALDEYFQPQRLGRGLLLRVGVRGRLAPNDFAVLDDNEGHEEVVIVATKHLGKGDEEGHPNAANDAGWFPQGGKCDH